jgi:hypothetical protein
VGKGDGGRDVPAEWVAAKVLDMETRSGYGLASKNAAMYSAGINLVGKEIR